MKNPDQLSSIFWFLVGIVIALWSLKYGVGTFGEPGIGFITFFAGAILAFLAAVLFLTPLRMEKEPKGFRGLWAGLDVKKVVYVLVLLVVYIVFLRSAGFLLSTFILLFLLFRVKGTYRLVTAVILSIVVTAVSYLVFGMWLQAQLPKGILG